MTRLSAFAVGFVATMSTFWLVWEVFGTYS
jgi:hypothetical protein